MDFVRTSSTPAHRRRLTLAVASLAFVVAGCSSPETGVENIGNDTSTSSTTTIMAAPTGPLFAQRPSLQNDADAVVIFANGFELTDQRFIATVDLDSNRVVNRITTYNNQLNNATLTLVGRYNDRVYVSMAESVPTSETAEPNDSPITVYSLGLLEDTAVGTDATTNEDEGVAEFSVANSAWVQASASGRYIATVSFPTETKRIVEFVDLDEQRDANGSRKAKSRYEYDVNVETSTVFLWNSTSDQFIVARQGEGSEELEIVTVDPDNGNAEFNAIATGLPLAEAELAYLMQPNGDMSIRVSVPGTIAEEDSEPRDFKTYALDGTQLDAGTYQVRFGDNAFETPQPTSYFVDAQRASASQLAEIYCASASCIVKQVALFDWKVDRQRNVDDVTQITEVADNLIADLIF